MTVILLALLVLAAAAAAAAAGLTFGPALHRRVTTTNPVDECRQFLGSGELQHADAETVSLSGQNPRGLGAGGV